MLSLIASQWSRSFGDLTVTDRPLSDVDPVQFGTLLQEPATLNLYTVLLRHTNEGDGLSRLSAVGCRPAGGSIPTADAANIRSQPVRWPSG